MTTLAVATPNGHVPAHRAAIRPAGIYATPPGPQCEHVDWEKAGTRGYDENGRCITRLRRCDRAKHCHAHHHLHLEDRMAELRRTSPRLAADIESGVVTV